LRKIILKIGVCGNFNFNGDAIGGQTIRTRLIYSELSKVYGKNSLMVIDTSKWKRTFILIILRSIIMTIRCKNIVILPAHNGIKILVPLFVIFKKLFRKKLHYVVIGAWLADDLKENKLLTFFVKEIDYIYTQTQVLKDKLRNLNLRNKIIIFPNFRDKSYLNDTLDYNYEEKSLKTCIISRINKMKGVSDAIEAISKLISDGYKIQLDIYGPIENIYTEEFEEKLYSQVDFIKYKGQIPHDKIISVLRGYDILLFPTKYLNEGFPGTIIDAYYAGVPVIASNWESSKEVIHDGKTGVIFNFDDKIDFIDKIKYLADNPKVLKEMKLECLKTSKLYTSQNLMRILFDNFK
jgi:glycosyltransferase involved in cell wall biosynthesis